MIWPKLYSNGVDQGWISTNESGIWINKTPGMALPHGMSLLTMTRLEGWFMSQKKLVVACCSHQLFSINHINRWEQVQIYPNTSQTLCQFSLATVATGNTVGWLQKGFIINIYIYMCVCVSLHVPCCPVYVDHDIYIYTHTYWSWKISHNKMKGIFHLHRLPQRIGWWHWHYLLHGSRQMPKWCVPNILQ